MDEFCELIYLGSTTDVCARWSQTRKIIPKLVSTNISRTNAQVTTEKLVLQSLQFNLKKLKKRRIEYKLKWNIIKQASVYSKESGGCNLCLEEKTSIMFADKKTSLNKRTEIMQKCRHREEHLLKNK